MRIDPLRQGVIFLRRPSTFELAAILARFIQLEVESIFKIRELSRADRIFRQNRRNENHAVGLRQHQIAGQHNRPPDSNGH